MPTEICRHIRANGTRCGSPALRGEALCYFHRRDRERYPNRIHRSVDDDTPAILHSLQYDRERLQREPMLAEYLAPAPATLEFPALEDRESIQIALSMLLSALGRNELEPKRAGMMLYGLQVASSNAKSLTRDPATVTETVVDEQGLELAPDEDPETTDDTTPSILDQLLQQIETETPGPLPQPS